MNSTRSAILPFASPLRAILLGFCLANAVNAVATKPYSPYPVPDFPHHVYWGDMHVHTEQSMDANALGNRLSPETAYRFAKGKTVVSTTGVPMKLSRPLDFILLSDHASFMGLFPLLRNGDRRAMATDPGIHWGPYFRAGRNMELLFEMMRLNFSENMRKTATEMKMTPDPELLAAVWRDATAIADRHNEPGRFTAFIGYEWTAQPRGDNLHRNVVFRDAAKHANQVIPFSAIDSQDPEDLWHFLAGYETKTGGQVLAIPHNANGSNGLMFSDKTYTGDPLTRAYAETRMRWEPIVELTQIKGDGEAHPVLSPDDEFADFESWDQGNMGGGRPKEDWMLRHEYARGALKLGLELEAQLGANPYKFGMMGSSDTHTSLAAVDEDNFSGKFAKDEPRLRMPGQDPVNLGDALKVERSQARPAIDYAAAGYMAAWATENTREALFDAMRRKETYATTGPRMLVRFFGGWDFHPGDDKRSDHASIGYGKGVPMSGDLEKAPQGKAPRFLVSAGRDPMGANLDRVQIVKGWLDREGNAQEKVYDVALSDGRAVDLDTGKAPALNSTVDLATATYSNSIGAPFLGVVWEDPEFDPKRKAFYYLRVLEIPTPRWTTYEAVLYGLERPVRVPAEIQERAYTSPIWYSPPAQAGGE